MKVVIGTYLRMQEAREKMKSMLKDQKGVTMVEYALMVALVAVALITAIGTLKDGVSSTFTTVAGKMP